jgi:hypothetical protein
MLTYVVLGVAALALGVGALALWFAVMARSEAITCRRELSRHRAAHAAAAEAGRAPEERRTARHRPPEEPVTGPPTAQITAQPPETEAIVAQTPTGQQRATRLPRPGRIR